MRASARLLLICLVVPASACGAVHEGPLDAAMPEDGATGDASIAAPVSSERVDLAPTSGGGAARPGGATGEDAARPLEATDGIGDGAARPLEATDGTGEGAARPLEATGARRACALPASGDCGPPSSERANQRDDVAIAWRVDNVGGGADYRVAAVSPRWVALTRTTWGPPPPPDRDPPSSTQELLVLRASTGEPVLRVTGWAMAHDERWGRPYVDLAGDRVLTLMSPRTLVAHSLPEGRELWRVTLADPDATSAPDRPFVLTGERVVWLSSYLSARVLDAATGQTLFELPPGDAWFSHGRIVHRRYGEELSLYDADTGARLARLPWPWSIRSAPEAGIYHTETEMRVVDPETLALGPARRPMPATFLAVIGDVAVASGRARTRILTLPSFVPRWAADRATDRAFRTSDGVLLCSEGGTVSMHDPTDGRTRWTWNVVDCSGVSVLRASERGDIVLAEDPSGVLALAGGAGAEPQPLTLTGRVRIGSRPLAGVVVRVGDRRVRTREDGTYTARVRARGMIRVWIPEREVRRATGLPCAYDERVAVPADEGRRRVDFDLSAHEYPDSDYCGNECNCDCAG